MKPGCCVSSSLLLLSNQTERGLEQLTQGLAGLDISQTSGGHTPATSTAVGGARPKVRLSPEKVTCEGEVKAESEEVTPEQSQSAESTLPQPQVSLQSLHLRFPTMLCFPRSVRAH